MTMGFHHLPPEVRRIIYEYYFTFLGNGRTEFDIAPCLRSAKPETERMPEKCTSLLHVCAEMAAEGAAILYGRHQYCFTEEDLPHVATWLLSIGEKNRNLLRRVRLHMALFEEGDLENADLQSNFSENLVAGLNVLGQAASPLALQISFREIGQLFTFKDGRYFIESLHQKTKNRRIFLELSLPGLSALKALKELKGLRGLDVVFEEVYVPLPKAGEDRELLKRIVIAYASLWGFQAEIAARQRKIENKDA